MTWTRDEMAAIAAQELNDGDYVNLDAAAPRAFQVTFHSPISSAS